ncbi:AAA family ATPase [Nocardia sp. BMG51109]|uniref:helix-turn-helix transcriptional regulator n=1 Tax=Nocardia sp. BMG51109 TaxID=1056816 RepID=UPI00046353A1|nr:AAA family ATPase [Nocardia sp. BMG51109]
MYEPGIGPVGDLPMPTHTFVGRDRELAQIDDLLLSGVFRLITLAGPGGIGKTRLAAEAVRRFRAGNTAVRVHWVRLARLAACSDHAAVERETARSVIEADFSERPGWEVLVDTLAGGEAAGRDRRTVLVFDNCEHVLDGLVRFITDLLEAIPGLTVVATSRGPIGWIDEHLVNVPPLTEQQALTLFRQRAGLTGHPVTGADQEAIAADICRRVHNHPLYIQLAAARLRHRSPAGIRAELSGRADDRRMQWTTGPRAGADPRHRRVTDVIRWSYELCSDAERLLFDRLSVFAAGYDTNPDDGNAGVADVGADLAAIRAVCGSGPDDGDTVISLPGNEIQRLLDGLVDQSLVTVHITTSTVRYSLLESLRVFASEQLRRRSGDDAGEPARLARRHLRYYRDRVSDAAGRWFSPAERELLDWARASWDNIVTAIETSLTSPGEAASGLEICLGLIALRVPFVRGSMRDIRRWTERCLDATATETPQPAELQVAARSAIAWLAVRRGQSADANRLLEDCVAACVPQAGGTDWRNHPETDFGLPPQLELAWGTELFMDKRDPRAIVVLVRARDQFRRLDDGGGEMMAGMFAGIAAGLLGSSRQAHDISRYCLEHARGSGALWATSWAELSWAITLIKHGDPAAAEAVLRHALAHQLTMRDQWGAAWSVELRTWALGALIGRGGGERDRALATEIARLAGGVRALRTRLGIDIDAMGTFADESRRAVAAARRVLGGTAYAAAEARGARLRPEHNEVHRLALGEAIADTTPIVTESWCTLSAVQLEIAVLVAAGYTNGDIARRRGKSKRTVDAQVAAIFSKLGVSSRREIEKDVPARLVPDVEAELRRRLA